MARLALAAVLLLALAPTVSRLAESSGQRLPGVLLAMCTSGGLDLVERSSVWVDAQGQQPPSGAGQDDTCPHCPLLAKISPLLLAALVLAPLRAGPPPVDAPTRALPAIVLPHGLGARGPPLPL